MPVPKKRHTKSRRDRRRAHQALKKLLLVPCSHCGELILPHRVCPSCGYYKGKMVVDVLAKLDKKERKEKEKELRAKEREAAAGKPLSLEQLSKKS